MIRLTIDGTEHEVNDEVSNLIILISKERDELNSKYKLFTEWAAHRKKDIELCIEDFGELTPLLDDINDPE